MELILASTNIHKTRELKSLLKPLGFDLLTLFDFPGYVPPEESGSTFQDNALIKAISAANTHKKWALSDDSGLIVPSLQGQPGVHSARYAGVGATDRENCLKLLEAMVSFRDPEKRSAHFICAIALASPEGKSWVFQGTCEGLIEEEPRGRNGFSYDAIFRKHDYNKTFAELDEEIKSKVSHRRKALDKALLFLESLRAHALLD
ncbi:MAG: RdgB/HAM1 family non-canonical purine NTP pyrophosphatase [Chlamydiae bacterium]|nr:RdgB/HAM1 family non-canonical purine NTP pyrophosphatase [Chlamydiota bacterium]